MWTRDEPRLNMLKFLTHKLRTHSLNEENVSEKVGVGRLRAAKVAPPPENGRRSREQRSGTIASLTARGPLAPRGPRRLDPPGDATCRPETRERLRCGMTTGKDPSLRNPFCCRWRSGTPAPSLTTRPTAPTPVSARPGAAPAPPRVTTHERTHAHDSHSPAGFVFSAPLSKQYNNTKQPLSKPCVTRTRPVQLARRVR